MMSKGATVFDTAGAAYFPSATTKRAYTTIAFGDGKTIANFNMIDESRGSQASRLQLDAALDGTMHAIGTTTGLGTYSAVFFEGPICSDKGDTSVMKKYLSLKNLSERRATIYFYNSATAEEIKNTSKATAKFSGLLNNMAVSLVDQEGLVYIRVALGMIGSWESTENTNG